MSNSLICPKCQSGKIVGVTVAPKKLKELGLPKFTILGHQMCQDCSHIFERPVPLWLCYTSLVIGIILICPAIFVFIHQSNHPVDLRLGGEAGMAASQMYGPVVLASFGFMALLGSIRAFRNRRKG